MNRTAFDRPCPALAIQSESVSLLLTAKFSSRAGYLQQLSELRGAYLTLPRSGNRNEGWDVSAIDEKNCNLSWERHWK